MRGQVRREQAVEAHEWGFLLRLVILALCFSVGVVLGQGLARRAPAGTDRELERYLTDFFSLERGTSFSRQELLSTLLVYFRYPLLALFLGFFSAGTLLVPLLTAAYGFFLSYSVCCFTASFGRAGVLLALAVFGLRCLVTMPCYFTLAVPALRQSELRAAAVFGRGKRLQAVPYGSVRWLWLAAILLAGVFLELYWTPELVNFVLHQIL